MIRSSTNQRHTTAEGLPIPVSDPAPQLPTLESSATKKVRVAPIVIIMLLIGAGFGWMAGAGLYNTVYRPIPVANDPPAAMSDQPDTNSEPLSKPEPRREVREARGAEATIDRVPALTKFGAVGRILSRIVRVGRGRGHDKEHGKKHHREKRHSGH
jgi:hypothetical protein